MFDLFSFLAGKPFGLYITDSEVQVLQLKGSGGGPAIAAIGQKGLPAGTVAGGKIIREEVLAENLTALLRETSIKQNACILALPEEQCYEHVFEFPLDIKGKELKAALDKKVAETVPIPFNQIKYDFAVRRSKELQIVFVAATHQDILVRYYMLLRKLGNLKPVAIEPESLSLLRSLPLQSEEGKNFILLYAKKQSVNWFLLWNGFIFDDSTVPLDEKDFTERLWNDLNKSKEFFTKKTGEKIDHVILAGNQGVLTTLENALKEKDSAPLIKLGGGLISMGGLSLENPELFYAVSGAALKAWGMTGLMSMNVDLLKSL